MRLLSLALLPLLSGCFSTTPNLSPVPLEAGRVEIGAAGGTAFSYLIGDPGDASNAVPGAWGGAARVGLGAGYDVGLEMLQLPRADQSQVRVSFRHGGRRERRPVATLVFVTAGTSDERRGGYVGISRVKARTWEADGTTYAGFHILAGGGKNPNPGYYEGDGNSASLGAGVQWGVERRFGRAFVRAEGGVTYVLPWFLQGSGLVSAGVRF
ncbi:MAG: hypothetical protein LCH53_02735 [Bacteroidetes bacterium]|nr:hypothetical protein [Bacteroidota bacterium]